MMNEKLKSVRDVLIEGLKRNGYDGLFYPGECACLLDDLAPCDEDPLRCEPGVKRDCDGDCARDHGGTWHIEHGRRAGEEE